MCWRKKNQLNKIEYKNERKNVKIHSFPMGTSKVEKWITSSSLPTTRTITITTITPRFLRIFHSFIQAFFSIIFCKNFITVILLRSIRMLKILKMKIMKKNYPLKFQSILDGTLSFGTIPNILSMIYSFRYKWAKREFQELKLDRYI